MRGGFFSNFEAIPLNLAGLHVIPTGESGNGAEVYGTINGLVGRYAAEAVQMEGSVIDPDFRINGCVMGISCEGWDARVYVDIPIDIDVQFRPIYQRDTEDYLVKEWFQRRTLQDPRDSRYSNMGNEELWREYKLLP